MTRSMLVFVHIPKTAGTTLHKVITHQYSPREILIRHDVEGPLSDAIPAASGKLPAVVMGHLSVGLHRYHPGVRYITCLREPVSRMISHYYHALNDPGHYLHEAVKRDNLDLAGYVTSGLSGELSNGMTRMIAGVSDFHGSVMSQQVLELAKRNFEEQFAAVLFSECFDEGLLDLAGKMGWSRPWYIRRKVGSYPPARAAMKACAREAIERCNSFDLELYHWALNRFQPSPELMKEAVDFQIRNRRYGKLVFACREVSRRIRVWDR